MKLYLNSKVNIALGLIFAFLLNSFGPWPASAFSINQLPVPGAMVGESAPFTPLSLKGLVVNPQKPLEFQFIVDTGNALDQQGQPGDMASAVSPSSLPSNRALSVKATQRQRVAALKQQANQLVKYFLAGLTIPEGDLWVNLSPYEKNRMVPNALGQTDLGRDLLAQDYILKQLTASLIYPEKDLGKEFWGRVYARAQQQFGTTNIPVNTFNKVWILPDQAQVFEHDSAAYVTKATLKVMLDEDYTALLKHNTTNTSNIGSNIIRQIILPEITKEVNTGKNFAPLRQIYQALILAKWYKETIQNGLLDAVYTNKNKVQGLVIPAKAGIHKKNDVEAIYNRYLQAYKKGVFNYIKEEPIGNVIARSASQRSASDEAISYIPRKYFSGGFTCMGMTVTRTPNPAMIHANGAMAVMDITLKMPGFRQSAAMDTLLSRAQLEDKAMVYLNSEQAMNHDYSPGEILKVYYGPKSENPDANDDLPGREGRYVYHDKIKFRRFMILGNNGTEGVLHKYQLMSFHLDTNEIGMGNFLALKRVDIPRARVDMEFPEEASGVSYKNYILVDLGDGISIKVEKFFNVDSKEKTPTDIIISDNGTIFSRKLNLPYKQDGVITAIRIIRQALEYSQDGSISSDELVKSLAHMAANGAMTTDEVKFESKDFKMEDVQKLNDGKVLFSDAIEPLELLFWSRLPTEDEGSLIKRLGLDKFANKKQMEDLDALIVHLSDNQLERGKLTVTFIADPKSKQGQGVIRITINQGRTDLRGWEKLEINQTGYSRVGLNYLTDLTRRRSDKALSLGGAGLAYVGEFLKRNDGSVRYKISATNPYLMTTEIYVKARLAPNSRLNAAMKKADKKNKSSGRRNFLKWTAGAIVVGAAGIAGIKLLIRPSRGPMTTLEKMDAILKASVVHDPKDLMAVDLTMKIARMLFDQHVFSTMEDLTQQGRIVVHKVTDQQMSEIYQMAQGVGQVQKGIIEEDGLTIHIEFKDKPSQYVVIVPEKIFANPSDLFPTLIHEVFGHVVSPQLEGALHNPAGEEVRAYTIELSAINEVLKNAQIILDGAKGELNKEQLDWLTQALDLQQLDAVRKRDTRRLESYQKADQAMNNNRPQLTEMGEMISGVPNELRNELIKKFPKKAPNDIRKLEQAWIKAVIVAGYNSYGRSSKGDLLSLVKKQRNMAKIHDMVFENLLPKLNEKYGLSIGFNIEVGFYWDKAQLSTPGGIDFNRINVKRNGNRIKVYFDPAQLATLESTDFKGFTPVVTGFHYIDSPFPLLGVNKPASSLN